MSMDRDIDETRYHGRGNCEKFQSEGESSPSVFYYGLYRLSEYVTESITER